MRKFAMRKLLVATLGLSLILFAPVRAQASPCSWDTNAGWVARENAKPGSANWATNIPIEYAGDYARRDQVGGFLKWIETGIKGKRVEGWLESASATCGQTLKLHISGNAAPVKISLYRMGYYQGAQARLINEVTTKEAIPAFDAPTISSAPKSLVTNNWPVSFQMKITKETPPGQYLFRLDDGVGKSTFVPLMITNPENRYGLTFVSSVITWQAYNEWGGYSLYKGPNLKRNSRATVVSFQRPYDGDGSGQTRYMELPLLRLIEEDGIDLNYATDFEVEENSSEIKDANSILLGGHDEYWTNNMRKNLDDAVARGVNLINFGANTGYNRIRLEGNQLEMWRSKMDPFAADKEKATKPWRLLPIGKPESLLLGAQYIGLGVSGDFKVTHPNRWPFNAMQNPESLKMVVGREVDSPFYSPGPEVESLATSEIKVHGKRAIAMATYYTNKSGAGILNISTNGWICSMAGNCPWHSYVPESVRLDVRAVTQAILRDANIGELARRHPMIVDLKTRTKTLPLGSVD